MILGPSGDEVEDGSDSIFMLWKHFTWIGEPCKNFDLIFSRLEPFIGCRVNFADKLRMLIRHKISGMIDCSAVSGSHKIRNLGKRMGRRGPW